MEPQQRRRKRGVILSSQGLKKLQDARYEAESQKNYGERYTLEALSERTGLDLSTVAKVLEQEAGVDKRTLERFFRAFNLELAKSDYLKPDLTEQLERAVPPRQSATSRQIQPTLNTDAFPQQDTHQDLREAVESAVFYGREEELTKLKQWILNDGCRLIALLGMGGIGKTSLAAKLVEQTKEEFEYVQWLSLRNAPPVQEILSTLR